MAISNKILLVPILMLIALSTVNTLIIFQKRGMMTSFATQTAQVSLTILAPSEVIAPYNLDAVLNEDKVSVNINWTKIPDADYYNIYYSSNISALKKINTSNLSSQIFNISGILNNNWTDLNAGNVRQRYYTVSSVNDGIENVSTEFVGKFDIEIKKATLIPGQVELNTISFPLIPNDCRVEKIIPVASDFDTIAYYNTAKPGYDSVFYDSIEGMWLGDFDCFEPGKGYLFGAIDTGYNFTLTGDVPEGNITVEVKKADLIPGHIELNTLGWNTPITKCGLSNLIPVASDFDTIAYYNTAKPGYDSVFYDSIEGMWLGDFDCFEPGRGYLFGAIDVGYNWTYNRS